MRIIEDNDYHKNDTLLSDEILIKAMISIYNNIIINREYDIPYLAGYSKDGKIIYIDRHIPKILIDENGIEYSIDYLLVLHESIEKSILEKFDIVYQEAHQIALRIEKEAVIAIGLSWELYDSYMQRYIKMVGDENLKKVPLDLDLKPYINEQDQEELLKIMKAY